MMTTWTAEQLIEKIATVSENVALCAGVGGMELAGQIVSALAARPELIPRFMTEGTELLLAGEVGPEKGCLTFYNRKLEVVTPQQLRMSYQVRDMVRGAHGCFGGREMNGNAEPNSGWEAALRINLEALRIAAGAGQEQNATAIVENVVEFCRTLAGNDT